jgi:hypothetical protein
LANSEKAITGMKDAQCCREGKDEQKTRYKAVAW